MMVDGRWKRAEEQVVEKGKSKEMTPTDRFPWPVHMQLLEVEQEQGRAQEGLIRQKGSQGILILGY
jgi:hypothetical protein